MMAAKNGASAEPASGSTVDAEEVAKFAAMAEAWWDPLGKFKPLHKFNPVRLAYIRDRVCAHFGREPRSKTPLEGLRLLDIGCGGGLVAEPMRRLGADVTAIDAVDKNIEVARLHASQSGLEIDYRNTTVEDLAAEQIEPFDIVLNLEVVEHVADVDLFLTTAARLVKPGGVMLLASINRTVKAFALAKVGAEYVLRWLPAGTHDPRKFVKPDEAKSALARGGMTVTGETGVTYFPLLDIWRITDDVAVNYMLSAVK
ncbi:MAG: bifunctional 2-polyprenyl-6-hydroxyphenol methylase/3-demethylubiquinol 3-O-methyltransferase UbiG [Pseudomonadota bacterium]